jgi:hypothetical protein
MIHQAWDSLRLWCEHTPELPQGWLWATWVPRSVDSNLNHTKDKDKARAEDVGMPMDNTHPAWPSGGSWDNAGSANRAEPQQRHMSGRFCYIDYANMWEGGRDVLSNGISFHHIMKSVASSVN